MNFNHVLRRFSLGKTLASLGAVLLLSNPAVSAQDWETSPASNKETVVSSNAEVSPLPPPVVTPPSDGTVDTEATPAKAAPSVFGVLPRGAKDDEVAQPPAAEAASDVKKLSLQECITQAMSTQPALQAARASYGAAYNAWRGLYELPRGSRLLSRDLPIRLDQACLGVQIAQAGLAQAEWDTRYAVTRNFYSVVYARQQSAQVARIVGKLDRAYKRALELVKLGDPTIKVNQIDVDQLYIARQKTKARGLEATIGVNRALAALHEAIGIDSNLPLDVADEKFPDLVSDLEMKELIVKALAQRGEMSQAQLTAQVTGLEIDAQAKTWFKPASRTFAMGGDIHATQIPQGLANTEYRPGAIPPEMPVSMFGPRWVRMERARFFTARADAVVEKTQNLISLETKIAYWKWKEAAERLKLYSGDPNVKDDSLTLRSRKIADLIEERFINGKVTGKEFLEAQGAADTSVIEYNEAMYIHALGLAGLERVTAGGIRVTQP